MASAHARLLRPDTVEPRENRGEGRAATSILRPKLGKAAGLPHEGRLNPGASHHSAQRWRGWTRPANCRGRYTEWPSSNREGLLLYSTIRSVDATSCRKPGSLRGGFGSTSENGSLRLMVNQEKRWLTTVAEGLAFLGFEFRQARGRLLYMWPRAKACQHIRQRVREVVRSFRSSEPIGVVIQKLNPVLNGSCTYFRVGNSNRVFHEVDWAVRSELRLWLRRKH